MKYLYLGDELNENTYFYEVDEEIISGTGARFELEDRIQAGGNGVVHNCSSVGDQEEYAIKFQIVLSEQRRRRFQREVKLLRELKHDHIVQYIADGTKIGGDTHGVQVEVPFVVMERADMGLDEYLSINRPVGREIYVPQFRGLASALGALHKHAYHRDLKPSNFLVSGERWVLADVGLCKFHDTDLDDELTQDGEDVGPRSWLSPEAQRRRGGEQLAHTPAEDVYLLANVFWFVVTGNQWLRSSDDQKTAAANELGPIFAVLERALSLNPDDRPQNGIEFSEELIKVR